MTIGQRRRDELFQAINGTGLDMRTLMFRHDTAPSRVSVGHKPSLSIFTVTEMLPAFRLEWKVTDGPSSHPSQAVRDWDDVLTVAAFWSGEVKYVAGSPDLWAELEKSRGLLVSGTEEAADNSPFNRDEQAEIAARVEKAKECAREDEELTAEHVAAIEQKLDQLLEASTRVGRKDWLVMLQGTAFSLLVADAVPQHVVTGIITTVLSGLGHIFGIGGPPPTLSA